MKLEHTAKWHLKRMTGLFLCIGIFLILQRQTGEEIDSTEKDILDGYLVMLLLGGSQSISIRNVLGNNTSLKKLLTGIKLSRFSRALSKY